MLLHDFILEKSETHGARPALLRNDMCLTYAELADEVMTISNSLKLLGIRKGERVAVYLNKRIEGVVAYFAASLAGAVFVPVNPVLKPAQVAHILNDCSVSVLITSNSHITALGESLENCKSLRFLIDVDNVENTFPRPQSSEIRTWSGIKNMTGIARPSSCIDNDVAAILYTSGSTGKPKGVVLSHRNMTVGATSVAGYLENSTDDVILAALPLSFDAGFSQLTTAFCAGAAVVLYDFLLPQDVPKAVMKYGVTGLTGVPPLWNQLANLRWPAEAIDSMRYIANTGGAMPTATLDKLRALFPATKVYLMYGLTESFRSTYLPPEELDERPTSIGKAIPNTEVLVLNKDGKPCASGEPGELVHRGALVALGYWNDPERSAKRFRPVPPALTELPFDEIAVWSGDTVVKDEDGFLFFVGRTDDMIKSSGYRISPTEVEEVIHATGLVSECAALGIPHPTVGQAIVVVVTSQNEANRDADAIINACKKALPTFMVPSKVIYHEELPRNPNGKIDRKQLATQHHELFLETG